MIEIGQRMKQLRERAGFSQAKMGNTAGVGQTTIARIETGQIAPSIKLLLWYADYFNVSLDYIFARTDKPQGELYKPTISASEEEMRDFIEMCFDPNSEMYDKLKRSLIQLMRGSKE